jgi:hypothetical protein
MEDLRSALFCASSARTATMTTKRRRRQQTSGEHDIGQPPALDFYQLSSLNLFLSSQSGSDKIVAADDHKNEL